MHISICNSYLEYRKNYYKAISKKADKAIGNLAKTSHKRINGQ